MKRIPISAAKHIAETYGYDQVMIYARKVDRPAGVGETAKNEIKGGEHMCCCQPEKILGTIELSSLALRQHVYVPPEYPSFFYPEAVKEIVQSVRCEEIELRHFFDVTASELELAVYSDDRPIEFWRKFKEFREGEFVTEPPRL